MKRASKQYTITITLSDKYSDDDTSALESAVSNLEYDGFIIHSSRIEETQ